MVFYRKYKNFRNDLFRSELVNELSNYDINNIEYDIFLGTLLKILDKYAPIKKVFEGKPCYFYDQGSKKSNYDEIKTKE